TMTTTVGDTASSVLAIFNVGLAPLTISGFEAPSPAFSLSPAPPFRLPPESESAVSLRFHPVAAVRDSGQVRFTSADPFGPGLSIPLSFEALSLSVATSALVPADGSPSGQPVIIHVVPESGHHVEQGTLYFRPAGDVDFAHVELVQPNGLDEFFAIIPG